MRTATDNKVRWLSVLILTLTALVSVGCQRLGNAAGASEREETVQGLRFAELFAHGADNTAPLIVALHGRGGSPEGLERIWRDFPMRAEIALPQAPIAFEGGWAWFDWPPGMSDDDLAAAVDRASDRVWKAATELARGRKVMVMGFSQGGVICYALAARHLDQLAYAFPVSGRLPNKLLPRIQVSASPVYALHGTEDPVIDVRSARESVAAFQRNGTVAQLHEFAAVGHTITPEMRDDLWAHVQGSHR